MSGLKLGTTDQELGQRDAVHVAIATVEAMDNLEPGQRIGFSFGSETKVGSAESKGVKKTIGIVDPFLRAPVQKYDKFIMVLDPDTVTDLRHSWSHIDFKDEIPTEVDFDDSCRGC